MVLAFDFTVLIKRLDKTIQQIQQDDCRVNLFPNNPPLLRNCTCCLKDCLLQMSQRSLRTCLVFYPNGVSAYEPKTCILRKAMRVSHAEEASAVQVHSPRLSVVPETSGPAEKARGEAGSAKAAQPAVGTAPAGTTEPAGPTGGAGPVDTGPVKIAGTEAGCELKIVLERHATDDPERVKNETLASTTAAAVPDPALAAGSAESPAFSSLTSSSSISSACFSPRAKRSRASDKLNQWAHQHYRLLDMRDVLSGLLIHYEHTYGPSGEKSAQPAPEFLNDFLKIEVGEFANITKKNNFCCVADSDTLRELLRKFWNYPRVPIFHRFDSDAAAATAAAATAAAATAAAATTAAATAAATTAAASDAATAAGVEGCGEKDPELVGIFSVIDLLHLLERLTVFESSLTSDSFVPGENPSTTFVRKQSLTAIDSWNAGMIKAEVQPSHAKKFSNLQICFEDDSLLNAMKILNKTGFSALPIVAHSNPRQCIGIFSVRDLIPILLQQTDYTVSGVLLAIPIFDYICGIRRAQSLKARYPVVHVSQNTTIDGVIGKILAVNVGRLLLTDKEGLLVGVLSVTDLGRFIAQKLAGKVDLEFSGSF